MVVRIIPDQKMSNKGALLEKKLAEVVNRYCKLSNSLRSII